MPTREKKKTEEKITLLRQENFRCHLHNEDRRTALIKTIRSLPDLGRSKSSKVGLAHYQEEKTAPLPQRREKYTAPKEGNCRRKSFIIKRESKRKEPGDSGHQEPAL